MVTIERRFEARSHQKLDPKTWKRRNVVRISPLLALDLNDPGQAAWGFPWDVTDVVTKSENGRPLLLAAPPSAWKGMENDGVIPAVTVMFRGNPTQNWQPGHYANVVKAARYMSLEDLVKLGGKKAK